MTEPLHLVLAFHNHQPVGNFDHVFEHAYQDAYRPFLDVFEPYEELKISLHLSGPLAHWLEEHHAHYLDRIARLAQSGRVELLGGPHYEAILTMLSPRDRVGQIEHYTQWLARRFGVRVRGMWTPERVWEPALAASLAQAGMEFTVLDDFHFKAAGLDQEELYGYFVTEEDGRLLFLFPGSERLRYLIPFGTIEETLDYLRHVAQQQPGAVVVFGDDGEKFGVWPETKKHVYQDRWLARFFDALVENRSWLRTCTFQDVLGSVPPAGKIYLPECSYREMTEWVLDVRRQRELEQLRQACQEDPRWQLARRFIRGGFWRNFKVKYPEANEMYCRQLAVSRRLQRLEEQHGQDLPLLEQAREELYRGQCNCAYWHGAFGGLYLPHLRHAVYRHLIAADRLMDQVEHGPRPSYVAAVAQDWNLDARQEVRLENERMTLWLAPSRGGHLYELDLKEFGLNLLATMTRREEAYHEKVRAHAQSHQHDVASIHDRVVLKQPDLDRHLFYDSLPQKALVDRFLPRDVSLEQLAHAQAPELGDFALGVYQARVRRSPQEVQLVLSREGQVEGHLLRLTKTVSLRAGESTVRVHYRLEGIPPQGLHFAPQWQAAGLPPGLEDRYFQTLEGEHRGHLGCWLDWAPGPGIQLVDRYQDLLLTLRWDKPAALWAYPVETVNGSEAGFELVHQSVALLPHWFIPAEQGPCWEVGLELSFARASEPQAVLPAIPTAADSPRAEE